MSLRIQQAFIRKHEQTIKSIRYKKTKTNHLVSIVYIFLLILLQYLSTDDLSNIKVRFNKMRLLILLSGLSSTQNYCQNWDQVKATSTEPAVKTSSEKSYCESLNWMDTHSTVHQVLKVVVLGMAQAKIQFTLTPQHTWSLVPFRLEPSNQTWIFPAPHMTVPFGPEKWLYVL